MISDLINKITIWFGSLGYWGVFFACLGIFPAEIVITMVGAVKPHNLAGISVAAALGEMIGAIPTYLIGYYFRNKDILKFLDGKGKFLKVSEQSYNNGYDSIKKRGVIYLFVTRFVPWLRVATALVAGYIRYNIVLLSIAVFAGTFLYAYAFAFIGAGIGFNWEQISKIIDTFNNSMLLLTAIGISVYVYTNRAKLFKK